jgi:DNA replicative helicase MCM subunit Mcm2 (Cdc46/Mcm family)
MTPNKNIGMLESLLSVVNLIFIIIDDNNPEKDKGFRERVCRNDCLAPKVIEVFTTANQ